MLHKTSIIRMLSIAVLVFSTAIDVCAQQNNNPATPKKPTFGERFQNAFRNMFRDEDDAPKKTTDVRINSQGVTTPTQPPKPLTAAEIKQAEKSGKRDNLESGVNTAGRAATAPRTPLHALKDNDNDSDENDETIFYRLRAMRQRVFTAEDIDAHIQPAAKPAVNERNTPQTNVLDIPDPFLVAGQHNKSLPYQDIPTEQAVSVPQDQRTLPRVDVPVINKQDLAPAEPLPLESFNTEEKNTSVPPRLELTTEGPPKTVVGQEAVYRIRIKNTGNAAAEQFSMSAEIPNWIEIRQADVTGGKATTEQRKENSQILDLMWNISRIEAGKSEMLALRFVPKQRKTVDLRMKYDFYRPMVTAKIEVQEPLLSLDLQGPDEVLWGSEVLYTLLVRNTGNGDAEEVHLELLQTGSELKECVLPVLRAGEEQPIDIKVWTGKQEYIDINIQASGKYNLQTKVERRVKVRRPNLDLNVDAPTVQFLGNNAELGISIKNNGNAAAKDFEIKSAIPLGTQFVSAAGGGAYNAASNQVVWKIPSLAIGESFDTQLICIPKTEGQCKIETTVSDPGGELAKTSSVFDVEAVIELKLDVDNPLGPVEIGKDAVFTIRIRNTGTKVAENVEVTMAFDRGLEPADVEGGDAVFNDGQVIFDKKPSIPAGQELLLKVRTKADRAANIRVRTEVTCKSANVHLVDEHATYFYSKK